MAPKVDRIIMQRKLTDVVDVNGRYCSRLGPTVTYIGKARRQDDGTWKCLANVNGQLCVVEVSITFEQEAP